MLPGVSPDPVWPRIRCSSRPTIVRARRIAVLREVMQLALLFAVVLLFRARNEVRLPFATRSALLTVLILAGVAIVLHIALSHVVPKIRARQIASTWSERERQRLARCE